MGALDSMKSPKEEGTTRESSNLSHIVGEGYVDGVTEAHRFQVPNEFSL